MKLRPLKFKEWLALLEKGYNPPAIRTQKDEIQFQTEMRQLYNWLVEHLSVFGEEGDYYGISDFKVEPDLRDRPTTKAPPASHTREFYITIITRKFHKTNYLDVLHEFLSSEAPGYRILIDKDFDPKWTLRIALTLKLAQIYCTNTKERSRLKDILRRLP
jgi:hypothetical protein